MQQRLDRLEKMIAILQERHCRQPVENKQGLACSSDGVFPDADTPLPSIESEDVIMEEGYQDANTPGKDQVLFDERRSNDEMKLDSELKSRKLTWKEIVGIVC